MKKNEKKMISILIIVSVVILVVLLIWNKTANKEAQKKADGQEQKNEEYVEVLEDGTKLNTSEKAKETKRLGELEVKGIQITNGKGRTMILATVTNTGSKDMELTPIIVTLYDNKGNELEKINGVISPVKAGESVQMNVGSTRDYSNVYDFTIETR